MSGLSYRAPRGWRHAAEHEAGALLRPVRDRGWFRANLLVSDEAVPLAVSDERRWTAALEHLRGRRQGLSVVADTHAALPAGRALLRLVTFDLPGGCVAQLHVQLSAAPGRGAADRLVCDVVATVGFDELDAHADAFLALLASVRIR